MIEAYTYFSIAFSSILFIVLSAFWTHAFKSLCCDLSDKNKSDTLVSILCLVGLGFMCICMLLCIFNTVSPFYLTDQLHLILFISWVVFNTGMCMVTSFFLYSLFLTSNATTFGYSPCFLWSLQIFQCAFYCFKILHHSYAFVVDFNLHYVVLEFYIILQTIIHILLLILFNRILYFVAKQSFVISNTKNIEQHRAVNRLLNVAVKYTVLIWLMASNGIIVSVLCFCDGLGVHFGLSAEAFYKIFWIAQYLDCASMGICVYLKMGFSNKVYNVVCALPHAFCSKCAQKCVQNKWSSKDAKNVEYIEKSVVEPSAPAPTKTIDETVNV